MKLEGDGDLEGIVMQQLSLHSHESDVQIFPRTLIGREVYGQLLVYENP